MSLVNRIWPRKRNIMCGGQAFSIGVGVFVVLAALVAIVWGFVLLPGFLQGALGIALVAFLVLLWGISLHGRYADGGFARRRERRRQERAWDKAMARQRREEEARHHAEYLRKRGPLPPWHVLVRRGYVAADRFLVALNAEFWAFLAYVVQATPGNLLWLAQHLPSVPVLLARNIGRMLRRHGLTMLLFGITLAHALAMAVWMNNSIILLLQVAAILGVRAGWAILDQRFIPTSHERWHAVVYLSSLVPWAVWLAFQSGWLLSLVAGWALLILSAYIGALAMGVLLAVIYECDDGTAPRYEYDDPLEA